ncbi:MAG: ribosome silencing factor [Shimia sp.]
MEDNVLSLSSYAGNSAEVSGAMTGGRIEPTSDAMIALITDTLDSEKAEDIVRIDLRGKSEMGDWMVIASGRSTRQVAALAEKLIDKVKATFGVVSKIEGKSQGDWVLIDTGDVIVHVFRPEVREFYQLEKMWLTPEEQAARTAKAAAEG